MSLARANKITMNADPSRLDGILLLRFLIKQVEEKWFVVLVCSLERTTVDFSASAHQLL